MKNQTEKQCVYCGESETKDDPVKKWTFTDEDVCFGCRTEFLYDEFFPQKGKKGNEGNILSA
ncbi:MAG: hypothetical protein AABY22_30645 [Nanoarchaeota archaeon]